MKQMPKYNEEYYYITATGIIQKVHWQNDEFDLGCFGIGNCYETKELAEQKLKELKEKIENGLNTKM